MLWLLEEIGKTLVGIKMTMTPKAKKFNQFQEILKFWNFDIVSFPPLKLFYIGVYCISTFVKCAISMVWIACIGQGKQNVCLAWLTYWGNWYTCKYNTFILIHKYNHDFVIL